MSKERLAQDTGQQVKAFRAVFGRTPCLRAAPPPSSRSWPACLHSLHDAIKEMSKHYNQKASLEQELPTITQKLCTTTECLLGSLGSLTSSTGQIATFFSSNLDFFTSSGYSPRGSTAVKKARPQSVPYRDALSNRRVLTSSTESREGLSQQVQQSQDKIARLEQEKEHWLLEAQLGKVRLEKENQRIADLEAQLAAAQGGSLNSPPAAAGTPVQSQEEAEMEPKAGEREATLCTSLVLSLIGCCAC
ncbi:Protein phosphatase 1 regulatory subunit 21 [Dissostichus eleginoides]|uniref:Protein phosphatase 1 regulatory subunit 21 n=1 Tax=Dissostichus eleginoides TaxID=100907 RepID=A0AAD9CK46_DISEL|nr:Protein phosphatase 1 regulatory subunit 21 [Dissostichus eleginoides]